MLTKRSKRRVTFDDIFVNFTKSIHYTWFKRCSCFFRYTIRRNKLFSTCFYSSIYFLLGHEIQHYHCHELRFAYCNTCDLIVFIIKAWKWTEETHPKHRWNKIWICQISCDFFTFSRSFSCFHMLFIFINSVNLNVFIYILSGFGKIDINYNRSAF